MQRATKTNAACNVDQCTECHLQPRLLLARKLLRERRVLVVLLLRQTRPLESSVVRSAAHSAAPTAAPKLRFKWAARALRRGTRAYAQGLPVLLL